jgi:starch-binding outer membrane protein, SusD/RagB family
MKMNSFKIFLLILLVGFGLGACKNFLTPDKDNQYTKDRFAKDPAWALGLMLNGYATSAAFPGAYPMDEVATDDAVSNNVADNYLRIATGEWSALFDPSNVWSSAYTAILNLNYFLTIVDNVEWSWQDTIRNRLFKIRYKGEAYGLRGYYYFKLLERCGGIGTNGELMGVPIVNDVITSTDDWKIQRSTFQETLDQANADLDKGIALLPYKYADIPNPSPGYQVSWNRVNGGTININLMDGRDVRAIKAKLYLLAGSPAFNGGTTYNPDKMDTVVQILGKLITVNGGLASLSPDALWWDADNDVTPLPGNPDILWRNNNSTSNTLESQNYPPSLYGTGRVNPTQNFVDAFPTKKGYPITWPDTLVSGYTPKTNPYANRDPRLNMMVLYNGGKERIYGSIGSNNVINTQADNPANFGVNDGLNKQSGYTTRTGYYLKKLLRVAVNMTPGSTTTLLHYYARIRWTELFLAWAEAANEKYGPDGNGGFAFTPRQIVGALRARGAKTTSGSTTYTLPGIDQPDTYLATITDAAGMRAMIRNERRIELSFEGFRFWDLRRWNVPMAQLTAGANGVSITGIAPAVPVYNYTAAGVNPVEKRIYAPYQIYGPIPYLETKKYPGFIQNAGW